MKKKKEIEINWCYLDVILGIVVLLVLLFICYALYDVAQDIFEPVVITETETVFVEKPIIQTKVEVIEIKSTEYIYDDSTREILARVVMSEAGIEDVDCKQAVLYTILNRVDSDKFPNTVYEVVTQRNQYSTADNGEPTDECYLVVDEVLRQRSTNEMPFPKDMYYFRNDYFHEGTKPYAKIDDLYFSCQYEK